MEQQQDIPGRDDSGETGPEGCKFQPGQLQIPELQMVEEPIRSLLVEYSKVPDSDVPKHVTDLRDRAYAMFPFPCIAWFLFLDLSLRSFHEYPEVLNRLKTGEKFLDLGCAFGQELRGLAYDGAPFETLYGSDLHPGLIELGYNLFRDRSRVQSSHFLSADIFDDSSELMTQFTGELDIILTSYVFHLFSWEQQVDIAKRIIQLLRPQAGSLLLGRNAAHINNGGMKQRTSSSGENFVSLFYHNCESWKELWEQVQRETGVKFQVDVWEDYEDHSLRHNPNRAGMFILWFAIRRV